MECLLIEDDQDDQEIFLLCLSEVRPDITCRVAGSGVEALKLLLEDESFVPAVIFLDVNMPRMNGLDCLQQLRAISRLRGSGIYVYSTTCEPGIVRRTKELGANDYLVKPTSTNELKAMLQKRFAV